MRKLKMKWIGSFFVAVLLAFTATSCLDNDDNPEPAPVALVSLYQGSPDAPDMDIEVDNRQINFYPFEYTDYTGYLRFYTGDRNLRFGPYAASNVVIDTTVTFNPNKVYSVFVVDEYEDASVVVLNDNSDKPASGKSKIRIINLSPDAGSFDFVSGDEGNMVAEGLSFKEATDFVSMDADEYDFQVRVSGTDDVELTVPDIDIQPGYFYTIIIRGFVTPPGGNSNVLSVQIVLN